MEDLKVIGELLTVDLVGGWIILSDLQALPFSWELGIKLAVAASVIVYNIVRTYTTIKSRNK